MREHYQIRVHIIEARGLRGPDGNKGFSVNPRTKIRILAGEGATLVDQSQYTRKADATNSVFWDEVRMFTVDLSRDQFNSGKMEVAVEDVGMFSNTTIGSAFFDLTTVYDRGYHEIFGEWVALMSQAKGAAVQGFVRLSLTVLREGDTPKLHQAHELDDVDPPEGQLSMPMPGLEVEAYQLVVRIIRAEVNPFGIAKPKMQVRVRFGSTEVKSRISPPRYEHNFYDELRMPIYMPTLTDRIRIDILDTGNILGPVQLADASLSFLSLAADPMETGWLNMYGVRKLAPSVLGSIGRTEDESASDTAYCARMLMFATAYQPPPEEHLSVMSLPKLFSKTELDALQPREQVYMLRCDLYDAIGLPAGPFDSFYVVAALGPHEQKSSYCSMNEGVVHFESSSPGKEGYYEQLEDIKVSMPTDTDQHFDVFIHVYASTPMGDRRLGYLRYSTAALMRSVDDPDGMFPFDRSLGAPTPRWIYLLPDPVELEHLEMASCMLQFSLVFGLDKEVNTMGRKRRKIPKLRPYTLYANIFAATGLSPANDNGLADPYVRVSLAGVTERTQTIEASLNPMWYQQLALKVYLPGELTFASKVSVCVYDAGAAFGLSALQDLAPSDTVMGRTLAPSGSYTKNVSVFYNKSAGEPIWMPLYDPKFAELDFDAGGDDDPTPVGFLLCSFELRAYQPPKSLDAPDGTKSAAIVDLSSQAAKLSKYHLTEGVSALGYLRPEMRPYVIEVQLVGCRDVPPREVLGAPVFLTSPYVEFEYGDEQAEEREWRIPDHGSSITGTQLRTGTDINILETRYFKVLLPTQPQLYTPWMGVRVREAGKIIPFVGDDWDPVMGITAINLLEHMPEEQAKIKEAKARKIKEAEEEAQKKEKERDEKSKKEKVQGGHFQIVKSPNEEKLDELFLSSVARVTNGSKALSVSAGKNVAPVPGLGPRTIEMPELQEGAVAAPAPGDVPDEGGGEEEEDEEARAAEEEILPYPMEKLLEDDLPFQLFPLSMKAPESTTSSYKQNLLAKGLQTARDLFPIKFGRPARSQGLLKMKLRVIKYEGDEELKLFLKEDPPANLRKLFAEKPCRVRVHVYGATSLAPRAGGKEPEPFLKVYNVEGQERTTRDIALPPSLEPDFYQSFELSAILPGQSRLHLEVWDYQLLSESLLGKTVIDLEDRYFSETWKTKQQNDALPKEMRPLTNPGNTNAQGFIVCKIEILEKKYAIAQPMVPIEPPTTDMFELRVIVWDAIDVQARDESFFGGGGTSDVFVAITPHGHQPYSMLRTDVHHRSPGDAEFFWRMVWPMALPEKSPRLFIQLWDADILSSNDAIGEAQLTLKTICELALRRGGGVKRENVLVQTTHPNYMGNQGTVRLTIELIPRYEAIQRPVGQGRDPPNQHPFLPNPVRPSFFDGLGIDFNLFNPFFFFKKYAMCCGVCCVVLVVVVVIVLLNSM